MKIRQIGMQGAADGKGYVKTYTVSFKRDPEKPWKAVWQNGKSKVSNSLFITAIKGFLLTIQISEETSFTI